MFFNRPPASGGRPGFEATVVSQPLDDTSPPSDLAISGMPTDFGDEPPAEVAPRGLPQPTEPPAPSHIGRYALKQRLGQGGLGTVHEAWDPLLSRTVAIKTLRLGVDALARTTLEAMFLHEARTAAALSHPHIVTVHDAGLAPEGVYIAMERLRGRDLRQALWSGWRPEPKQAAQIARRVADALAYAHARGVVHCDVKPANIFLTRQGRPKVVDFGIARVAHRTALPLPEQTVAGSPHYLAPEQWRGETVDARCDVYALGVVLYEMLCGRRPFEGLSVDAIRAAALQPSLQPPHEIDAAAPRALSRIAMRAMAPRPDDRYASAAQMSRELRHWCARERAQRRGPTARPAPQRRAPAARWVAIAALLAAGLLGGWMVTRPLLDTAPALPHAATAATPLSAP